MTFAQTATKIITIQPKQTLYAIARQYNIPVADLKNLNVEYAPSFTLSIGDKFKIPANAEEIMTWQESLNPNAVPTKKTTTATSAPVVKNPTASASNATTPTKTTSTVTETAKTVTPSVIEPKPNVVIEKPISVPQETSPSLNKPIIGVHVVKKGETASTIARKYGMSLKDLLSLNKLSPKAGVKIGQKLKVRTHSASPQVAPVIYKPINPSVIASATATNSATKIEISTPVKSATEEKNKVAEQPKNETKPTIKENTNTSTKTATVQEDALFVDIKNAPAPKAEKPAENTEKHTAKENVPNDNIVEKTAAAKVEEKKTEQPKVVETKKEEPKEEKPKFVETPKDPNAPAPVKAKDLAEKTNLTSVKTALIEQTANVDSKQLETSFNRTVNPNSKRTLRGIATVVKNPELTSSSFVFYNYAEEGDIVKVVNLMSKKVMYLKVVGKMNAGESDAILQVSSDTAKLLQANEGRFLVEVTGY